MCLEPASSTQHHSSTQPPAQPLPSPCPAPAQPPAQAPSSLTSWTAPGAGPAGTCSERAPQPAPSAGSAARPAWEQQQQVMTATPLGHRCCARLWHVQAMLALYVASMCLIPDSSRCHASSSQAAEYVRQHVEHLQPAACSRQQGHMSHSIQGAAAPQQQQPSTACPTS
jgi:hypothetical protein